MATRVNKCTKMVMYSRRLGPQSAFQPPAGSAHTGPNSQYDLVASQMGRPKLMPKPHGTPMSNTQSTTSTMMRRRAIVNRKLRFATNVANMVIIPSFMVRPPPSVSAFWAKYL